MDEKEIVNKIKNKEINYLYYPGRDGTLYVVSDVAILSNSFFIKDVIKTGLLDKGFGIDLHLINIGKFPVYSTWISSYESNMHYKKVKLNGQGIYIYRRILRFENSYDCRLLMDALI